MKTFVKSLAILFSLIGSAANSSKVRFSFASCQHHGGNDPALEGNLYVLTTYEQMIEAAVGQPATVLVGLQVPEAGVPTGFNTVVYDNFTLMRTSGVWELSGSIDGAAFKASFKNEQGVQSVLFTSEEGSFTAICEIAKG